MTELEFYIDGQRIDLFEFSDSPVKLNYILLDLQFLDKRGGVISNIFKIPATKSNNQKLNFYYDVQSTNPERFVAPKPAQIILGGVTLFNGTVTGKAAWIADNPESYELMLKGNNLEWSDKLKELPIIELDLPTITWDEASVRDSWNNTYADKYVAPLVIYGNTVHYQITWNTGSKRWEVNHGTGNPLQWHYSDFRYWLFVYPMIKDMFAKAGFSIESAWLESSEAKEFIVYFNDTDAYNAVDQYGNLVTSINYKTDVIKKERMCLDFFKGIANRFNLLFYTDNERKIVYMEPFDSFFNGSVDVTNKVDLSKSRKLSQYSDVLKNIYYHDRMDQHGTWYLENLLPLNQQVSYSLDPKLLLDGGYYYGGYKFFETAKENTDIESYFEGITTGIISLDANKEIYMPFILDQSINPVCFIDTTTGLQSCSYPLPFPSGEVEPRFARYAGMTSMKNALDQSSIGAKFRYHSDAAISNRPFAYICDYAEEAGGHNYHYSDQWNSVSEEYKLRYFPFYVPIFTPKLLPGVISKHYSNFLYSIYYGRYTETNLLIKGVDILNEIQRKNIQLYQAVWVLLEISNYTPSNNTTTKCTLLENKKADQDFIDKLLYGGNFHTLYRF